MNVVCYQRSISLLCRNLSIVITCSLVLGTTKPQLHALPLTPLVTTAPLCLLAIAIVLAQTFQWSYLPGRRRECLHVVLSN